MGEAESKLYKKFKLDESWDSKHNLPLLKQMPAIFKSSHVEDNTKTTFLRVDGRLSKPINKVQCFLVNSDPSRSAIEWSKPSSVSVAELRQSQYPSIVLYTDGVVAQLKDRTKNGITKDEAEEFIKSHVANLMSKNASELSNSYASKVQLMPGHEFLKPKYPIGANDADGTGAQVDRKRLLEVFPAVLSKSRLQPIKQVLNMNVVVVETKANHYWVSPSDSALPQDGQLEFSLVSGDVLLKASRSGHSDSAWFQVRRIDGTLRVVAEYLD